MLPLEMTRSQGLLLTQIYEDIAFSKITWSHRLESRVGGEFNSPGGGMTNREGQGRTCT